MKSGHSVAMLLPIEKKPLGEPVDRRTAPRFAVSAPVIFHWCDESRHMHEGAGFTCNISTAGVFVESSNLPPAGSRIALEVSFPALQKTAVGGVKLNSEGMVVRVGEVARNGGFAATSNFVLPIETEKAKPAQISKRDLGNHGPQDEI